MRKFMITLMLLAVLLVGGMTFAQDATACPAGLDAAVCTLLDESTVAMGQLKSIAFDLDISVTTEGQTQPFISGNGAASGDYDGVDMAALNTADPMAALTALPDLLGRFQAELNINLTGMLPLELKLVNGIGYLNFGGVAPLLGGSEALAAQGLPTGWGGLDLNDILTNLAPMLAGADMGDMSATTPSEGDAMALAASLEQYITASATSDGATTTVAANVDLAGLLADPALAGLLQQQIDAQAGVTGTELSTEDVTALLQGSTFVFTQTVDNNSKLLTAFTFDMTLDGSVISPDAPEGAMVTVNGKINLRDYNAVPAIVAPEGPVATFADVMTLLSSTGGGF